jgi:hypothetical protein
VEALMQQLALAQVREMLTADVPAPKRCPPRRKGKKARRRPRWLWPELAPPIRTKKLRQVPDRANRLGHKPVSMGTWPLTDDEREEHADVEYDLKVRGVPRAFPASLAECPTGPCVHVGCPENLYLTFVESRGKCPGGGQAMVEYRTGAGYGTCPACSKRFGGIYPVGARTPVHRGAPSIIRNFPDKEISELRETCAMRVANAAEAAGDETSTEEVAKLINLTHERARQIEKGALPKIRPYLERRALARSVGPS